MSLRDLKLIADTRAALADGSARLARKTAGVSADELAHVVGVSGPAVRYWEAGKRVPGEGNALAYGRALAALARKAA